MKITDITPEYRIKPNKTSITVKDDKGKTKGVITDCRTFHNMATREQFELHSQLKKIGVNNLSVASKCIFKDGEIYFLYNISPRKFVEKYGAFNNSEQERLNELETEAKQLRERGITVIECLFIA